MFVDEDIQLERLMEEKSLFRRQKALARIQFANAFNRKKKTLLMFIIDNNGSLEQTEKQLKTVLKSWDLQKRCET